MLLHLFYQFVLDEIFQDVPTSVMFGMLSKIRKQRKNLVAHTRDHETSCNAAVNAWSQYRITEQGISPWLSVPWNWTGNFCEQSEKSYKTLQRWRVCVSSPPKLWAVSLPVHLCWMILQREKKHNFSFFAAVRLAPYLLVPCVHIAKQKKDINFPLLSVK